MSQVVQKLASVHPGEVLREDFLAGFNLSPIAVARAIGVPRTRIERLVRGETAMTADTALRLAKLFGTSAAFWMNIQARYDLETAEDLIGMQIEEIEPLKQNAA